MTLDEDSESYHQVSCQFKFRHREDKTRIEKMLLDLILEAKRKKRESDPLDRIFLYTDDNLIGQSIHWYMVDNNKNVTTFRYQDITQGAIAPLSGIVIFNVIHKDFSAADTMLLLNDMRWCLLHCTRLILVVRSDIANLFRELINIDNTMILTEKKHHCMIFIAPSVLPQSAASFPYRRSFLPESARCWS